MKHLTAIIIILLILYSSISYSQDEINYHTIDKKTYEQFQKKEWKELIKTGKISLKNDIDFYYLQVRMGIAYYEQKNYSKAIKYFRKAHKSNSDDDVTSEYLYYSYLFSGQKNEARYISYSFNNELKEKLKIKKKPIINSLYFETKLDFNNDTLIKRKFGDLIKQKSLLDKSYYNISMEHSVGKRFTILHGYSNIKLTNQVKALPEDTLPAIFEEKVKQHEYYFSANWHVSKRTDLTFAFHYLHTNFYAQDYFALIYGSDKTVLYDYNENSYVGGVYMTNYFYKLRTKIGSSVSNLNNQLQIQPEFHLRFYPFGNSNLFSETSAILMMQKQNQKGNRGKNNPKPLPVFKQSIGINILNTLWFQPSFTYGDMQNYTEYNSFLANNDIDKTKMRFEGLLNYTFKKQKIDLFLSYQYNFKENTYLYNKAIKSQDYINQSVMGGIKFNF